MSTAHERPESTIWVNAVQPALRRAPLVLQTVQPQRVPREALVLSRAQFERPLVLLAQGVFYNLFFLLYLRSSKTAHRVVGYFEEEAVYGYTENLAGVDQGTYANVPAPQIAIDYWKLLVDARLREVIVPVGADEAHHRDVNHGFADRLAARRPSRYLRAGRLQM